MKMSTDVLTSASNSETEKLNETLRLLSRVSLSLRTSVEDKSPLIMRDEFYPEQDRFYSADNLSLRKLSAGRVAKKGVNFSNFL